MRDKKGIVGMLAALFGVLTWPILLILFFILLAVIGFGVFLTMNLFRLIGAALLIFAGMALIKGKGSKFMLWFLLLGIALMVLPIFIGAMQGVSLASVLG